MPNLVVYVPAAVARALEAKGVSQDIQRRACNEVLYGLAENGLVAGGLAAGDGSGVVAENRETGDAGGAGRAVTPERPVGVASPAASPGLGAEEGVDASPLRERPVAPMARPSSSAPSPRVFRPDPKRK